MFDCCSAYGYMNIKDCDEKCNENDFKLPSFANKRLLRKAFAEMLEKWTMWAGFTEGLDVLFVNIARMENPFFRPPGQQFREIPILVDVQWDFSKGTWFDTGYGQILEKDWGPDQYGISNKTVSPSFILISF